MSLHEYLESQKLAAQHPPFYALIMQAMRDADSGNLVRLRSAWPSVWEELEQRYHAPGGKLMEDISRRPSIDGCLACSWVSADRVHKFCQDCFDLRQEAGI